MNCVIKRILHIQKIISAPKYRISFIFTRNILRQFSQDGGNSNEYLQDVFGPKITKIYGKCPKNWNTKVSDKIASANRVDPDQTSPDQGLCCLPFH